MAHARLNDDRLTRYFLLFRGTKMVEWHYWHCTTQSAASHVRSRQRWCRCLVLLAYERQARPFQERSRLAANEFGDVFSRRSLGQIAIPLWSLCSPPGLSSIINSEDCPCELFELEAPQLVPSRSNLLCWDDEHPLDNHVRSPIDRLQARWGNLVKVAHRQSLKRNRHTNIPVVKNVVA